MSKPQSKPKFSFKKRMSLEFLGEEWKDGYILFQPVLLKDLETEYPTIAGIDKTNTGSIDKGLHALKNLLKEKFISGKGVDDNGQLIDIRKEDLDGFPTEFMSRAFDFLSQGVSPNTPKQ